MNILTRAVAAASLLFGCTTLAGNAIAVETLTLYTTADMEHLAVGEPFYVDVRLGGLADGRALDVLAATLLFDDGLLKADVPVVGAIVPTPLASTEDFLTLSTTGMVDGLFTTTSSDPRHLISSDGTFYRLRFTPLAVGSGDIHFDFAAATAFNADDPEAYLPVELAIGPSLPFSSAAVPEPGSLVLGGFGFLSVWIYLRRCRKG